MIYIPVNRKGEGKDRSIVDDIPAPMIPESISKFGLELNQNNIRSRINSPSITTVTDP